MRSKKQKKVSLDKRIKLEMTGVTIGWNDPDPCNKTNFITDCVVTHKNKTRNLMATKIYNRFQDYREKVLRETGQEVRMYYRIGITAFFTYDKKICKVERELKVFCAICEVEQESVNQIRSALREGDESKFTHVSFEVECLSAYAPPKSPEEILMEKLARELEAA